MIRLDEIQNGLDQGEFFLEYLPIIELAQARCVGAEALVRWQRPTGVVLPDDFIPLIEHTPLSGLLTYWVIDQVALELGDWLKDQQDVELHINVPPEILGRGGLEYAAQKSGLQTVRDKIVLEITERGLPDQLGLDALDQAARRGIRIALDDVTIDPASVLVLSRSNVRIIKIDKSVLQDVGDRQATPWVAALSALLKTTDLEVIAEGVETAEQLAVLRTAGVQRVQGHLFSPALRVDAFLDYFRRPGRALRNLASHGRASTPRSRGTKVQWHPMACTPSIFSITHCRPRSYACKHSRRLTISSPSPRALRATWAASTAFSCPRKIFTGARAT